MQTDAVMSAHELSHKVGTKLLFENDRVRVWEMVLQPGEESAYHEHASDYVFVYMTRSRLELIQNGKEPETSESGPGFVQYTEVGRGIEHKVRNVGSSEHKEVLVELKGPSHSVEPQKPQTNES
jgi:quercetin dioxygenase-like cupin family protein